MKIFSWHKKVLENQALKSSEDSSVDFGPGGVA